MLNACHSARTIVVKCTLTFLRLPQRGLYFSCCKAGFPQRHFKGNKGFRKPCKPTTGTPASHNDMTIQCYWGWGLHWSQMGCLIDKSVLCESISHWGSTKKVFQALLVSLWSPFSPETQDLTCTDSHHCERKNSRSVELLVILAKKTSTMIYVITNAKLQQPVQIQPLWRLKKCVPQTIQKTDFHTGQYSGGFAPRLSLPLKTKQFRKHAANTSPATQSHRKCTDCSKTIEAELGGFTVTQQSRTTQEASTFFKRQHTRNDIRSIITHLLVNWLSNGLSRLYVLFQAN